MKATNILATLALAGASILLAQDADRADPNKSAQKDSGKMSVPAADRQFVIKAAQGGAAEVKLGQLAQDKGSNQAVKDFGKQMVTDHSAANDELKGIASKKGITVPDTLTAKDQALYDRLSKMSGDQFDKAYINAMVKDHQTDVAEFRKESQQGKDADIKSFAAKTLPTLEHHLEAAKQAQSQIGAGASKTSSTEKTQ